MGQRRCDWSGANEFGSMIKMGPVMDRACGQLTTGARENTGHWERRLQSWNGGAWSVALNVLEGEQPSKSPVVSREKQMPNIAL